MLQVKAFSPKEAEENKPKILNTIIPSFVIKAVNNLVSINYSNHIKLYQEDIIKEIQKEYDLFTNFKDHLNRSEIYENKWLDFEPLFREQGWIVTYDKPGYNETYKPYYIFKTNT